MKVLGVAFAAMLALTGVGWYQQRSDIQAQQAQAELIDVRTHFYGVVAGKTKSSGYGVEERLARDLHDQLGAINPEAKALPEGITSFNVGTTNQYSGATSALGWSPFEYSSTCSDCGKLSADFKSMLLKIKQGEVDQLIESEQVSVNTGYTLTPFGMSGMSEAALIWLLGGPLSLFAAHRWAYATKNDYELRRFGDLDWRLDGTCDGAKVTLVALSPSFFIPYLAWRKHQRSEFAKQVQQKFPTETEVLNNVQRMLDRLGLGSGDSRAHLEAEELVKYLQRELESRTRAGDDARLDSHYQRIVAELSRVDDGLRSRDEGMAELDGLSLGEVPTAPQEQPELRRQQGTS
jgi:hypothetical protein